MQDIDENWSVIGWWSDDVVLDTMFFEMHTSHLFSFIFS